MSNVNLFRMSLALIAAITVYYNYYVPDDAHVYYGRPARAPTFVMSASVSSVPRECTVMNAASIDFDEGPGQSTAAILSVLSEQNTKATFHVDPQMLADPGMASLALSARNQGHLLGLRFPSALDPRNMTDDDIISTLIDSSNTFYAAIKAYPRYLRLPFGKTDQRIYDVCYNMGFLPTEWNVDPWDYRIPANADNATVQMELFDYTQQVLSSGEKKFIILLHDYIKLYTDPSVLRRYIALVKSLNLNLVTLDTCLGTSIKYRVSNFDYRKGPQQSYTQDISSSSSSSSASVSSSNAQSQPTGAATENKSSGATGMSFNEVSLSVMLITVVYALMA